MLSEQTIQAIINGLAIGKQRAQEQFTGEDYTRSEWIFDSVMESLQYVLDGLDTGSAMVDLLKSAQAAGEGEQA